ncbi:hypothetical protein LF1_08590 [Rubripirellula obstinata]|uniref:Uncharacterized protein n=1 Tax=Rubripirellula obstinata TaxID=406547 RepID=A0A5B1CDR7_9BACT|nr:hypothetical protein LF1_08590 [Rubripirellula obstinata]
MTPSGYTKYNDKMLAVYVGIKLVYITARCFVNHSVPMPPEVFQ